MYFNRFLFSFLGCCLISLCVACGSATRLTVAGHTPTNNGSTRPTTAPAQSKCSPVEIAAQSGPVPITMPPITLGNHPNIVYVVNERTGYQDCSILKRYDVITGKTFDIARIGNESIQEAQVSADGQWILFTAHISESSDYEVQIIRMDGQYLQTLYSYAEAIATFQWSTDQKLLMFYRQGLGAPDFDLWNPATGQKQRELLEQPPTLYQPRVWLDAKRIYVVDGSIAMNSQTPEHLYILDTSKGPNQLASDLHYVTKLSIPYAWDFDSSYDGSDLFISQCHCSADANTGKLSQRGPSSISVMPAGGGSQYAIYTSSTLAVTTVRATSQKTLLFLIENTSGDTSQNGLWKINSDGTDLTHLITAEIGDTILFNISASNLPHRWSNVSRDGNTYAIEIGKFQQMKPSTSLLFGSMNGGTPTTFASSSDGSALSIVGWTTM